MLTRRCSVMRDTAELSPQPLLYSINNNNNNNIGKHQLDNIGCSDSPRLRVRAGRRAEPMPLRKPQQNRASRSHLDQLLTNCNTKAMRYYRIWIYTCNAVLLVSVLGFCAVAGRTILGDYRRHLIPSLALYQPSFLYAYLAIFTQSGVIQIVGCLGALRLSERLLNVYWLMLLVLLFGDIVIGIFWMFRLDKMIQELRPGLRFRLYSEYSQGGEFTALWDRLQIESGCCGVQGPLDFANIRGPNVIQWNSSPMGVGTGTTAVDNSSASVKHLMPTSCCAVVQETDNATVAAAAAAAVVAKCHTVHTSGCEDRLRTYLRQTSETLFLIGYCVIAFVKVCFIGILRYEIREMIQKIKILKSEMESRPSVASIDLGSSPNIGTSSPSHTVLISSGTQNVNGSVRGAGMEGGTESERESLLVPEQDTPAHKRTSLGADDLEYHQKSTLHRKLFPGDSGTTDSESHCALLVEDGAQIKTPPNGNNNYEMREFQHHHQQQFLHVGGGVAPGTGCSRQPYRSSNPDANTHNM